MNDACDNLNTAQKSLFSPYHKNARFTKRLALLLQNYELSAPDPLPSVTRSTTLLIVTQLRVGNRHIVSQGTNLKITIFVLSPLEFNIHTMLPR